MSIRALLLKRCWGSWTQATSSAVRASLVRQTQDEALDAVARGAVGTLVSAAAVVRLLLARPGPGHLLRQAGGRKVPGMYARDRKKTRV